MGGTHSAFVKELTKREPSSRKLLSLIDTLHNEKKINLSDFNHMPTILLVCYYLEGNNLILTLERLLQYGADPEPDVKPQIIYMPVMYMIEKYGCCPFTVLCRKKPLKYIEAIQLIMTYCPEFKDLSNLKFVEIFRWINEISGYGDGTVFRNSEVDMSLDLTKLLVSKNIDLTSVKKYDKYTLGSLALVAYIRADHLNHSETVDILIYLINNGAPQDEVDSSGFTYIDYLLPEVQILFWEKYNNSIGKKNNNIYIAKKCMSCQIGGDNDNSGDSKVLEMQLTTCNHAVLCWDCFTKLPNQKCPYCNSEIIYSRSITYI